MRNSTSLRSANDTTLIFSVSPGQSAETTARMEMARKAPAARAANGRCGPSSACGMSRTRVSIIANRMRIVTAPP